MGGDTPKSNKGDLTPMTPKIDLSGILGMAKQGVRIYKESLYLMGFIGKN